MNLFDNILINILLITVPFCFYFLYLIYTKTLQKEKNDLFFTFAIVSSFYFVLKMEQPNYMIVTFAVINIPLLVSYMYHKKTTILILSILFSYYYYCNFTFPIILFICEYGLYLTLYYLLKNKNMNLFFNLFIIIKFVIIFLLIYKINDNIIFILSLLLILLIIAKFILYLFGKIEQIIVLHNNIEQIETDQKMYESLFKITHEIKNPIAVVKGYLDMYDIHNETHSLKYIPIMKNEIDRVLVLLEDFLSIKRLKIDKDIMDISLLLEEVIDSFQPLLESKQIEVNFDYDELYIEADYNRLKQVFINIIKNSVEAIIDNGKIDINIYINGKYLYIGVQDNGVGMSKEDIEKLNYPFYTTKSNGTGLGVYLSKEIIRKHNGIMNYESNEGVKVTVKLPYDASLN